MKILNELLSFLKVPLKILLPALCLFSGFLLLANERILEKLNLLTWTEKNGFTFGLIFIISLCMIVIYIVWFVFEVISKFWRSKTITKKIFKNFLKLNDMEQAIIIHLYHSTTYTDTLDYNQPIIKGLIARGYIYAGDGQLVSASVFDNSLPMRMTLQPGIYHALETYIPKMKLEIEKLKNKIDREKNSKKKTTLQNKLENIQDYYNYFVDRSI